MTVDTLDFRTSATGDGLTTAFTVPFQFIENAHLVVLLDNVRQTLGVDYTVSGAKVPTGGAVEMLVAPAAASVILIERDPPADQPTRYQPGTEFPSEDVEDDFDVAAHRDRWLRDAVDRALKVPRGSTANTDVPGYAGGGRIGWHPSRQEPDAVLRPVLARVRHGAGSGVAGDRGHSTGPASGDRRLPGGLWGQDRAALGGRWVPDRHPDSAQGWRCRVAGVRLADPAWS